MTATTSPSQNTDHIVQICRERSERGVATRADWARLAEINPDRAYRELKTYLQRHDSQQPADPYAKREGFRFAGMFLGFLAGVVFMVAWWFFAEWLHENIVTSARGWDVVTLTQYIAASLLPAFAFLGWRMDTKRNGAKEKETVEQRSLKNASWDDLLVEFDATRKAGGTRMY